MNPLFLYTKNIVLSLLLTFGCLNSILTFAQNQKIIIAIEKSPYGMLFTDIFVNGLPVKAIIDFGDPNRFQLSDTLLKQFQIPVKETNKIAIDDIGRKYKVFDGIIDSVRIGNCTFKNEPFSSSPDEMKLVGKQINTEFHAVVGWGFFSDYYITMNYRKKEIIISSTSETPGNVCFLSSLINESSYLIMQSKINGIDANLILDTGSPLTLLDSSFYNKNNFFSTDTQVFHLKDTIPLKTISTTFGNNSVAISYLIYDLTPTLFLAVGIIGGDIFDKYEIYIEPKEKMIYFSKEKLSN